MEQSTFKNTFISEFQVFEKNLNGGKNLSVHDVRKASFESFTSSILPSKKDENWKYTSLEDLYSKHFAPVYSNTEPVLSENQISQFLIPNLDVYRLVFVNGIFSPALSDLKNISDVAEVYPLSESIKIHSDFISTLVKDFSKSDKQIFSDLNAAFLNDGAFIRIKNGKIIEKPILLLFISDSKNGSLLNQPRNIIVAGKSSESTVIEQYVSLTDNSVYFTNAVTNLLAEENAVLHHIRIQNESESSFHIGAVQTLQNLNSTINTHSFSLGGEIVRNNIFADLQDLNAAVLLNGLYLGTGKQHIDNHTVINHAKPHCNSIEVYKGILDDQAVGIFDGKIFVLADAQKTNANQSNKNLLLANEAHDDAKPQLEIYADDVKCFHGATVGQLDEEQLFYLKSRGIGEEFARAILTHAFAIDVLNSIKIPEVRSYLDRLIMAKLNSPIEFEESTK